MLVPRRPCTIVEGPRLAQLFNTRGKEVQVRFICTAHGQHKCNDWKWSIEVLFNCMVCWRILRWGRNESSSQSYVFLHACLLAFVEEVSLGFVGTMCKCVTWVPQSAWAV
jgi:hypothetical protein